MKLIPNFQMDGNMRADFKNHKKTLRLDISRFIYFMGIN